jgi:hypothetical protein
VLDKTVDGYDIAVNPNEGKSFKQAKSIVKNSWRSVCSFAQKLFKYWSRNTIWVEISKPTEQGYRNLTSFSVLLSNPLHADDACVEYRRIFV